MKFRFMETNCLRDKDFLLYRENGTSDYLFVLFKSNAKVFSEGEFKDVAYGDAVLFDINKIQHYYPVSGEDFLHDFVHFEVETSYENAVVSEIPKGKIISLISPDTLSDSISIIEKEFYFGFSEYKVDILSHLGAAFLLRLKDEAQRGVADAQRKENLQAFIEVREKILKNPELDWNIDKMCNMACVSRSYFQHLYKALFGISCINDIINARIMKAKSLLPISSLKISAIANACGYKSTEHFIRQFKEKTGQTPNEYRA